MPDLRALVPGMLIAGPVGAGDDTAGRFGGPCTGLPCNGGTAGPAAAFPNPEDRS